MPSKEDKILLGSKTAKGWFQNEEDVIVLFNDWKNSPLSQMWLIKMWYLLEEIEYVNAVKVKWHFKADIQVQIQITIKLKEQIDCQNLSIKLVSNPQWFNQIDKRWVDTYAELWNMNDDIKSLLKYFSGELSPNIHNPRDSRRMFVDEFTEIEQRKLLWFFEDNKLLVITDILKWRWKFSAEWMLVILKDWISSDLRWALEPMNYVMNLFDGEVAISPQGSIKIWRITIQRKGWDGWRKTANMLQFKINPAILLLK